MAPARRLRSILARVFRYLADAVQPGAGPPGAPAAQPLPAAAAGNEHWFAVVRERAPELLTGGGIHGNGFLQACTRWQPRGFRVWLAF